jgi:hypothetical protein
MPQVPNNVKFGVPMLIVSFVAFAVVFWGFAQLIGEPARAAPPEVIEDGGGAGGGGPVSVTIVAKNLHDKKSLAPTRRLRSPSPSTTRPGVSHNIAFFTTRRNDAADPR